MNTLLRHSCTQQLSELSGYLLEDHWRGIAVPLVDAVVVSGAIKARSANWVMLKEMGSQSRQLAERESDRNMLAD